MPQHVFSGAGAPTSTPTARGQHYIDTTNSVHYESIGTSGATDWKPSAGLPIQHCFPYFTDTNYYISRTGTTYQIVSQIIFPGTDALANLTEVAIVSAESGTGSGKFRVYDVTNAQVICEIATISGTTPSIYKTTSISNLPAGEAIFELQLAHDNASGNTFLTTARLTCG